jgi:hypothetical protein
VNEVNWLAPLAALRTTRTGPPGPWSGGGGVGPAVLNDQLDVAITLPAVSVAPLTVAVYPVEVARAALGVNVAVVVAPS